MATERHVVFLGGGGLAVFQAAPPPSALCAKAASSVAQPSGTPSLCPPCHLLRDGGRGQFLYASGGGGTEIFLCEALA